MTVLIYLGKKMFIKTEAVDKLCVPFGLIIGPCTIISNLIKIVANVAKLIFYGLLTINYKSSEEFKKFKEADLELGNSYLF